jgi:hypothetical protein
MEDLNNSSSSSSSSSSSYSLKVYENIIDLSLFDNYVNLLKKDDYSMVILNKQLTDDLKNYLKSKNIEENEFNKSIFNSKGKLVCRSINFDFIATPESEKLIAFENEIVEFYPLFECSPVRIWFDKQWNATRYDNLEEMFLDINLFPLNFKIYNLDVNYTYLFFLTPNINEFNINYITSESTLILFRKIDNYTGKYDHFNFYAKYFDYFISPFKFENFKEALTYCNNVFQKTNDFAGLIAYSNNRYFKIISNRYKYLHKIRGKEDLYLTVCRYIQKSENQELETLLSLFPHINFNLIFNLYKSIAYNILHSNNLNEIENEIYKEYHKTIPNFTPDNGGQIKKYITNDVFNFVLSIVNKTDAEKIYQLYKNICNCCICDDFKYYLPENSNKNCDFCKNLNIKINLFSCGHYFCDCCLNKIKK